MLMYILYSILQAESLQKKCCGKMCRYFFFFFLNETQQGHVLLVLLNVNGILTDTFKLSF